MARIPLRVLGWEYDEETKRIVAIFTDVSAVDDSDPANFTPSLNLRVELLPRAIEEVRSNNQKKHRSSSSEPSWTTDDLILADLQDDTTS